MKTTPDRKPLYMFTVNVGDIMFCERELDDGCKIIPGNFNISELTFLHQQLDWLCSIKCWNVHPADQADIDTAIVHLLRKQAQIVSHKKAAA